MKHAAMGVGLAITLVPSVAVAGGEPDAMGGFEVQTESYDFGDEAFGAKGFGAPAEIRAVVYSPVALDEGPFPLVIMLHGRHATCYNPESPQGIPGDGSQLGAYGGWPCPGERIAIPSHEGYAGAATTLASHGYVVASISANGINAADNNIDDGGADARGRLIVTHLNQWAVFNGAGAAPFGRKYVGAVDLDRIGLFGHSRGGEGVAEAILLDQRSGGTVGIDAAFLLAPVDFQRLVLSNVALAVVLPYCDGDVIDLQGAHYFDDARYADPADVSEKYIFAMQGANHNYFNTVWSPSTFVSGALDDFGGLADFLETTDPDCSEGPGSSRLTEAQQQHVFAAYFAAFFRRHLGDEEDFEPMLRGDAVPESAGSAPVWTTYLAPSGPESRLDINHLDSAEALQTNTLGEAVFSRGVDPYDLCGLADANGVIDHCIDELGMFEGQVFDGREPHTPGLGQLRIAFSPGAQWVNALPAGTDASGYEFVQFRAAVDYEGPLRGAAGVEVTVALTDGRGASASRVVSDYTDALGPLVGTMAPLLPKKQLNGIRLPLAEFEDVDLTDLASIALSFDGAAGGLLLSDLGFSDPALADDSMGTGPGDTGEADSGGDAPMLDGESGERGPAVTTGGTGGDETETGTGDAQQPPDEGGGCGCTEGGRGHAVPALVLIALGMGAARRRAHESSKEQIEVRSPLREQAQIDPR